MKTVIFDLDGTLADITHRLHYIQGDKKDYDGFYHACFDDAPKPEIIALFHSLQRSEYDILIVSGRREGVRVKTEEWLLDRNIWPTALIMRPDNDHTPDHELKRSWLRSGRLGPKHDIIFCVDDRQRVVDMWRAEGLTCLQVEAWEE